MDETDPVTAASMGEHGESIPVPVTERVTHYRQGTLHGVKGIFPAAVLRQFGSEIEPTGGYTLAVVTQGDQRAMGIALCRNNENFSKAIGRQTAIGRAIKEIQHG